jgi:hypothetical protein
VADNSLIIKINADIKAFKAALAEVKSQTKDLESGLTEVAKISAIAFAGLVAEIGLAVKSFAETEKASKKLEQSLLNQGLSVSTLSKKYKEQADAAQDLTGIDNDLIIEGQAVLQSMVGQKEITEEMTRAAIELGVATGGDVKNGFEILGRALEGNTRGLKQFGITIEEGLSRQERFDKILSQVNQKLGGQAAAANQGLGSIKGLTSAFDDLQSKIGGQFAPIITSVIKKLTEFFNIISKNDVLVEWIALFLKAAVTIAGLVTAIASAILAWTSFSAVISAFGAVSGIALGPIGALAIGIGAIATAMVGFKLASDDALSSQEKLEKQIKQTKGSIDVLEAAQSGKSEIFPGKIGPGLVEQQKLKQQLQEEELRKLNTQQREAQSEQILTKRKAANAADREQKDKDARDKAAEDARINVLQLQAKNASKGTIEQAQKEADLKKQIAEATNKEERKALEKQLANVQKPALLGLTAERQGMFGSMIGAVGEGGESGAIGVMSQIIQLIPVFGGFLSQLFEFLAMGPEKAREVITSMLDAVPQIIQNVILAIPAVVLAWISNFPKMVNALIAQFPEIIKSFILQIPLIISEFIKQLPMIMMNFIGMLPTLWIEIIKAIPTIIVAFAQEFMKIPEKFGQAVIDAFKNLFGGIGDFFGGLFAQGGIVGAAGGIGVISGGYPGKDSVPILAQAGELIVPRANFNEVIEAVSAARMSNRGQNNFMGSGPSGGGSVNVVISMEGEAAEKVLTARQVEARSLGTLRESG